MSRKAKVQNSGLGRSIVKAKRNERKKRTEITDKHTTDIEPSKESILDQSDLVALMDYADLTGRQFAAEKQRTVIISNDAFSVEHIDEQRIQEMEKNWNNLAIPKRPKWDKSTTKEQLIQAEKESFHNWRTDLAKLEANEHLLLTPFERNLEIWRQLWRVVEFSDIVVQIVDARNPMLFRSPDLEKWVLSLPGFKKNLLLVNKADFLTEHQRELWADCFEKENIPFVFFSALESDRLLQENQVGPGVSDAPLVHSRTKVYSHQELLKFLVEECKKSSQTRAAASAPDGTSTTTDTTDRPDVPEPVAGAAEMKYTVGMVGYPNVGKSSTINVLLGVKKVAVSRTPGKTKHFQTLHIPDYPITLCDCPGLVFPTFSATRSDMVCDGLIRIAEIKDHVGPTRLVCERISRNVLESTYGIRLPAPGPNEPKNRPPRPEELLSLYAYIRGFMGGHGNPDQARAARQILNDYVDGTLLYCHPPPTCTLEEFTATTTNTETTTSTTATTADETTTTTTDSSAPTDADTQADDVEDGSGEEELVPENFTLDEDLNLSVSTQPLDRNPYTRQENGRKYQRRLKQKIQMEDNGSAFVTGKKKYGQKTHDPVTKRLPTGVKLTMKPKNPRRNAPRPTTGQGKVGTGGNPTATQEQATSV